MHSIILFILFTALTIACGQQQLLNITELEETQLNLSLNSTQPMKSLARESRCFCKLLGGGGFFPVAVPVNNVNSGFNPNNNVAATQLQADGRTALFNNQGQIIGYLPAGSTVTNAG